MGLARALRQVALLSRGTVISAEQKNTLKLLLLEHSAKAVTLNRVLERGDAAGLQQLLASAGGLASADGAAEKEQAPPRARSVRFGSVVAQTIGHAHHTDDYDRSVPDLPPRVERQLPPLGQLLLRTSTFGRHQWQTAFWIFDRNCLFLFCTKDDFVCHRPALHQLEFTADHFVSPITAKTYKHSGWVYSFKLMQKRVMGNTQVLKVGHPDDRPLRRMLDAVKGAIRGACFNRAHATQIAEADFIKSVALQDRNNANFDRELRLQPPAPPGGAGGMAEDDGWALPGSVWMEGDSLAPPCGSEPVVVRHIVALAELRDEDTLVDLGCGDGRICVAAAEASACKAIGVEVEESLVSQARSVISDKGLGDRVSVQQGDLLDFAERLEALGATVVVVYLLPAAVDALKPALLAHIDRGGRVITQCWGLAGVEPYELVDKYIDGVTVQLSLYANKSKNPS
eukprot:g3654.t1